MVTCPDSQLLSIYFDGEMPSPWKEKMESHIAACPVCARRLNAYGDNSLVKQISDAGEFTADMESARERVWQKLEQCAGSADHPPAWPSWAAQGRALWRRHISIPLPAAAVIFLLIALAFMLVLRAVETEGISDMAFASEAEIDAPGIIPVTDMESVLQYLGGRDNGEIIILRLPESRNFVNYGEPAIIRAADYSRITPNRNIQNRRKP